jgi:hypothetical protein
LPSALGSGTKWETIHLSASQQLTGTPFDAHAVDERKVPDVNYIHSSPTGNWQYEPILHWKRFQ